MTIKNSLQDLQIWLDDLSKDKSQLSLNFSDDNMSNVSYGAQPALTISAASVDTISLGAADNSSSSIGGGYNFQYDYKNTINGGYTITTGTGAGHNIGSILTTGINGLTYNDYGNVGQGSLQVKGDAEFEGDIKIKGKSLADTLEKIEEKLAILKPNEKLEEKWQELRDLRNRYIELEKEIIEKEKMWDILKK